MDNDGNLRVSVMATDSKGEVHTVKRIFTRHGNSPIPNQPIKLRKFMKTQGWDSLRFWPGMVLELCQIKCIRAGRTKLPSLETETIWSVEQSVDAIRRVNFDKTGDLFRVDYGIQVIFMSVRQLLTSICLLFCHFMNIIAGYCRYEVVGNNRFSGKSHRLKRLGALSEYRPYYGGWSF